MRKLLWNLFKLLVIAVVAYGIYDNYFKQEPVHTVSLDNSETILQNTRAEISEAVLGESRKTRELIVYEQDLSAKETISSAVLDFDVFRKSMEVTSYGTAVYTVDLSALSEADIRYDEEAALVTVTVPHAGLKSVTVDAEKTEFSDVEHGLLTWGAIKLTPEQQNLIEQELQKELTAAAEDQAILTRADLAAEEALRQLYGSVLAGLDSGLSVRIEFEA